MKSCVITTLGSGVIAARPAALDASTVVNSTPVGFNSRLMELPAVLYVMQAQEPSGAEVIHIDLMRADPNALLACPAGSATARLAEEAGVRTVGLPFRTLRHSGGPVETLRSLGRGLRSARDLRRLLRAHPERRLVYCVALRAGMLTSVAGVGLGRRAAWYVSDLPPSGPLGSLTRLLARRCSVPVATSRWVAAGFAGRSRRLRRHTRVVYPGVELTRFTRAAEPGAPRAAVVGHVSPTKQTQLAIEIARQVVCELPEFQLELLGRALYREEDFALERRLRDEVAADPALTGAVRFAGQVGDVPGELARFGLLLHCRPDEPFGVALIEAMAAGLPVVAPAAAGPMEIVEDGVTGLLYPPGDAGAAARRIVELASDRGLAGEMGAAARAAIERRFTTARQLEQLEQALAELAATP